MTECLYDLFQVGLFQRGLFQECPVVTDQPIRGGFELPGNYGIRGGKRRRRSEEELRAERFREIIREVEIASGIRPSQEPDAGAQDGAEVVGVDERAWTTPAVPDALSKALLESLLALPTEEIRLPIEPYPYVLSEGRAAAMEAARLHAIRLRDDEAAIVAILAAMVL